MLVLLVIMHLCLMIYVTSILNALVKLEKLHHDPILFRLC
jgi:hypothetical protein